MSRRMIYHPRRPLVHAVHAAAAVAALLVLPQAADDLT